MTLSPTRKVQPYRSMLAPPGFRAAWSTVVQVPAPSSPRCMGVSTWMSSSGSKPNVSGMRLQTISTTSSTARSGSSTSTKIEVRRGLRPFCLAESRHLALVDPVGVGDDAAGGGLAEDLRQPADGHGAGVDDIPQDAARARRREAGRRRRPGRSAACGNGPDRSARPAADRACWSRR